MFKCDFYSILKEDEPISGFATASALGNHSNIARRLFWQYCYTTVHSGTGDHLHKTVVRYWNIWHCHSLQYLKPPVYQM